MNQSPTERLARRINLLGKSFREKESGIAFLATSSLQHQLKHVPSASPRVLAPILSSSAQVVSAALGPCTGTKRPVRNALTHGLHGTMASRTSAQAQLQCAARVPTGATHECLRGGAASRRCHIPLRNQELQGRSLQLSIRWNQQQHRVTLRLNISMIYTGVVCQLAVICKASPRGSAGTEQTGVRDLPSRAQGQEGGVPGGDPGQ
jgi:hypothetical protein